MVSALTETTLERLEHHSTLYSSLFQDFIKGLTLQTKKDWFDSHKPFSHQIVKLLILHNGYLDETGLIKITSVLYDQKWISNVERVWLLGKKTEPGLNSVDSVYDYYIRTGEMPSDIPKSIFLGLVSLGKSHSNMGFLKALSSYLVNFMVVYRDGFEFIECFKGEERKLVQTYFSHRDIKIELVNSKWICSFSTFNQIRLDPAFKFILAYLDGLKIDEAADPVEMAVFPLADFDIRRNIQEVWVERYTGQLESLLRGLFALKKLTLVNRQPTHQMLAALMSIAFKLEKIECISNQKAAPIVVSSVLFRYLEKIKVNFPYKSF